MKETAEGKGFELEEISEALLDVANDWSGKWGTSHRVGERLRAIEARLYRLVMDAQDEAEEVR